MKKIFFNIACRVLPFLLSAPFFAHGQQSGGGDLTIEGVKTIMCNIADWIFTFSMVIGIVFVLVAAFTYITSGGNAEKVGTATKSILYAAIGILIGVLAKGVPAIVGSIVGRGDINACP